MLDYSSNPESYARHLATYISDLSTIRAHTINAWGRAPSLDRIANYRDKHLGNRGPSGRRQAALPRPEYFRCGHEISEGNAYRNRAGSRLCKTCRDEREAQQSARARKRASTAEQLKHFERQGVSIVTEVPPARSTFLIGDLLDRAARAFLITRDDLISQTRAMQFVYARAVVAKVLRERGMSFPQIGKHMNRDHSSIKNLVDTWEKKAKRCPDMVRVFEALR